VAECSGIVKKVDASLKERLMEERRGLPKPLRTKKGMTSLPAALKGWDFFMTLEISSSGMDKGEDIAGGV
jgi:hypothetical protein